jgi:tetratricopeptide (TPR) repeat protein
MGYLLERQGKLIEAEPYYAEALVINQRLEKVDDRRIAGVLDQIALRFRALNRPAEALTAYEAALTRRRRLHRGDQPDLAGNLSNLGSVLLDFLDRPSEALLRHEAALEMRQRLYQGDHREVASSLDAVACCLYVLDRRAEAASKREAARAMWTRLPDGELRIADFLARLGFLLLKQGKHTEAEPLLRECVAIREALTPESQDFWLLPSARSMLGGALAGQGALLIQANAPSAISKFTEAEPLLLESAEWLTRNPERIHHTHAVRVRQAVERMVRLYECWERAAPASGKAIRATQWRAALEKLSAQPQSEGNSSRPASPSRPTETRSSRK